MTTLHLADTPGYPLARRVTMGLEVPYQFGTLSIRFGALQVRPEGPPELIGSASGGEVADVTYRIPALTLTGRYALDAREDEPHGIDSGGNLLPFTTEPQPTVPTFARDELLRGGQQDEQTQWTNRAKRHRDEKLLKTENGRGLLRSYYRHNWAFCDIFEDSSALRAAWKKDGTVRRMSAHTYKVTDPAAGDNQPKINDWKDTDGSTYNLLAFDRQAVLATALGQAETDDKEKKKRFEAACDATADFATRVEGTGNSGSKTTHLTQKDVYGHIAKPPGCDSARYEMLHAVTRGEVDPDTLTPGTAPHEFSAEELHSLRKARRAVFSDNAEREPTATDTLYSGDCSARLEGVRIALGPPSPDGGRAAYARIELPDLALRIDDSAWGGPAGEVAMERLAAMGFISGIVQDAVSESVRHAALTGLAGYAPPAR
ncbi:hypothetical protein [Streptomyces sp. NPDC007100]|uniref:hypothetical protein n=1 Tax=Streptomyces sp. NPDC007100 TaxID=3155602 RepID=UPI0033E1919F